MPIAGSALDELMPPASGAVGEDEGGMNTLFF